MINAVTEAPQSFYSRTNNSIYCVSQLKLEQDDF